MPAVSMSSNGSNVVLSDAQAEHEAMVALRTADAEISRFDVTGDQSALRMATNLFWYANMLLDQVAEGEPS